jgi:hypothetical protein
MSLYLCREIKSNILFLKSIIIKGILRKQHQWHTLATCTLRATLWSPLIYINMLRQLTLSVKQKTSHSQSCSWKELDGWDNWEQCYLTVHILVMDNIKILQRYLLASYFGYTMIFTTYVTGWWCMTAWCQEEYLGPSRKWQETGENCTVRDSILCTLHQILLGSCIQGGWGGWGM